MEMALVVVALLVLMAAQAQAQWWWIHHKTEPERANFAKWVWYGDPKR